MSNSAMNIAVETIVQHPKVASTTTAILFTALLVFSRLRRQRGELNLRGPPSTSRLFGVSQDTFKAIDANPLYVKWSKIYGGVYRIPLALGDETVVLVDPKAISTFFSRDTYTYEQGSTLRGFIRNFGDSVLIAEAEDHKRQRRALSGGFSITAIRKLTPVFLLSAHRVSDCWKKTIQEGGGSSAVIEVQRWMNAITLDSIGNGGFSHDFEATNGKLSTLLQRFEAFADVKPSFAIMAAFLLSTVFPIISKVPTERSKRMGELSESIRELAVEIFENAKAEKHGYEETSLDKSILGALSKSETASDKIHMGVDEITAQIGLFMLAGYETTAAAISWCVTELARNPDVQENLRHELAGLNGQDPTYEQLSSGLPYLDAVVCETLRLHPSVQELNRQATADDVLPLRDPIVNADGEIVHAVPIPAGTKIRIPLGTLNIHEEFWGEDSHTFKPSRWLDDAVPRQSSRKAEISGFRHLLTFADGPRTCLGRLFAVTEFKAAISILFRDFSFEFCEGKDTKIAMHKVLTPRPKVEGQVGPFLPMIVRQL